MKTGRPRGFDREQALTTAMDLFWKKGFEATSKRDLMEATGVGSQSLYNAFGDKRSLYIEALHHYADGALKGLEDSLRASDSPLADVRAVINSWENGISEGCLLANTATEFGGNDEELSGFVAKQMARAMDTLAAALQRAQDAGELPADNDPARLALTLFSIRGGLCTMSRCGIPDATIKATIAAALALLP
ncbi:MAG: TetR/AcrR family transcriptional repressor of nem operon [Planctomycetota bacterium]|jgi:TetR/AcrR family transcriptional repressor of nem operon